jgi:hypothetical protein
MIVRSIFISLVVATSLSACGGDNGGNQGAEPAEADEPAADEDIPDLIIPENE